MNWWSEFADEIEHGAPLGRLTWFRLGGPARYLFRPRDANELAAMVSRARREHVPLKVLGAGANVLIKDDGFDGVVVRLDSDAFRKTQWSGSTVAVGAGVDLMPLARECCRRGLSGLEGMAGIPATIGGAIRMNAGGRFGEFGRVVRDADVLRPDGTMETWTHHQLGFGYRSSALTDEVVLSAGLELEQDDPVRITTTFDECFDYKMSSQPITDCSAGCIFKNPPGQSAGALIDRAGLKGKSYGNAQVSKRHANFIVADSEATASDVLGLIDLIRRRVRDLYDTELEVEVDIW